MACSLCDEGAGASSAIVSNRNPKFIPLYKKLINVIYLMLMKLVLLRLQRIQNFTINKLPDLIEINLKAKFLLNLSKALFTITLYTKLIIFYNLQFSISGAENLVTKSVAVMVFYSICKLAVKSALRQ